jgi:excisionase family DNA binding protein
MHEGTNRETITPLLIDRPTAARMLGVCSKTLYHMTARGELPVVKIGPRGLRYSVADLCRYIDEHRSSGRARAA